MTVKHTATCSAANQKNKLARVPATTSKSKSSRTDLHNQPLMFIPMKTKHKTSQTFIVQQNANGKLLHLHTEEVTKKTVLFKNLDVPNGRKIRVLKKEFNNQYTIVE